MLHYVLRWTVRQQSAALQACSQLYLRDEFVGPLLCTAGRRKGTVDIETSIKRTSSESTAAGTSATASKRSFYRLLVGTPHDNVLLLHEMLVLEHFPSPLTFRSTVQAPQGECSHGRLACRRPEQQVDGVDDRRPHKGRAQSGVPCCAGNDSLAVTASLIHERLLGLDTAIVTTFEKGNATRQVSGRHARILHFVACSVAQLCPSSYWSGPDLELCWVAVSITGEACLPVQQYLSSSNAGGVQDTQRGSMVATIWPPRQPRQLKMSEALAAKPSATPSSTAQAPPSDLASVPPPPGEAGVRPGPLAGATNRAERRATQQAPPPPPQRPVSMFDLLSGGMEDAAPQARDRIDADDSGSARVAHPKRFEPPATDEQASRWH